MKIDSDRRKVPLSLIVYRCILLLSSCLLLIHDLYIQDTFPNETEAFRGKDLGLSPTVISDCLDHALCAFPRTNVGAK